MIMYALNTIFALFGLVVYVGAGVLLFLAVRKAARLLSGHGKAVPQEGSDSVENP